ncbi:hypothetical protein D1AOALGA4SA_759 [Olavius algarvensis Delta 1 endosymbiont]|nr:hypothetical protein D1AOALGA4SA_759 [Olavius algarvensis Delta 1 endosymbiont]
MDTDPKRPVLVRPGGRPSFSSIKIIDGIYPKFHARYSLLNLGG